MKCGMNKHFKLACLNFFLIKHQIFHYITKIFSEHQKYPIFCFEKKTSSNNTVQKNQSNEMGMNGNGAGFISRRNSRESEKAARQLFQSSQCAPSIFNLDQKFHGFSCFWGIDIHETVQNKSRKKYVIKLPKFTIINMTRKYYQRASFSIENLFYEHYSFGSLMTDVFIE